MKRKSSNLEHDFTSKITNLFFLASCVVMKRYFSRWLNWKNYWVMEQPRTSRHCIIYIQREKDFTENNE